LQGARKDEGEEKMSSMRKMASSSKIIGRRLRKKMRVASDKQGSEEER